MARQYAKAKKRPSKRGKSKGASALGVFRLFAVFVLVFGFVGFLMFLRQVEVPSQKMRVVAEKEDAQKVTKRIVLPVDPVSSSKPENEERKKKAPSIVKSEVSKKTSKTAEPIKTQNDVAKKTERFQFYKELPKQKVVIPQKEIDGFKAKQRFEYTLQAGAFKVFSDADKLKAELALMGLESRILSREDASGNTWYKVQLGPYPGRRSMQKSLRRLQSLRLNPLIMKNRITEKAEDVQNSAKS